MATFIRPASRTTATVLNAVRTAIMSGQLAPGEQVRQQVWAEKCGASRPPVREALEILSNEGLLTHGLNQGYFVAKFSTDEMHQLYTMRHLLEREAIKSIEWPTPDALEALRERVVQFESSTQAGRPDIAMHALSELFLDIYRLSPRNLIVAEIERLWMRTASYRSLLLDVSTSPQDSSQRCAQIINALAARDRDTLAEFLQRPTLRGLRISGGPDSALGGAATAG